MHINGTIEAHSSGQNSAGKYLQDGEMTAGRNGWTIWYYTDWTLTLDFSSLDSDMV